jgi:hypothetical protein
VFELWTCRSKGTSREIGSIEAEKECRFLVPHGRSCPFPIIPFFHLCKNIRVLGVPGYFSRILCGVLTVQ